MEEETQEDVSMEVATSEVDITSEEATAAVLTEESSEVEDLMVDKGTTEGEEEVTLNAVDGAKPLKINSTAVKTKIKPKLL